MVSTCLPRARFQTPVTKKKKKRKEKKETICTLLDHNRIKKRSQ
jgi:hypothetical protein